MTKDKRRLRLRTKMGKMKEEDLKRHKMFREVEEEIGKLKIYFEFLEDDDMEVFGNSLSRMFDIGFDYAMSKTQEETNGK